jgi:hypothetical protein
MARVMVTRAPVSSKIKRRRFPMAHRFLAWFAAAALLCAVSAAQSPKPWTQPRTPWGDPDLQGIWTGTEMVGTPLQRPANLGDRTILNDEEFARRQAQRKAEEQFDTAEVVSPATRCDPSRGGLGNTPDTCRNGVSIGPPLYWQDRGEPNRQASLIVDPPDGRLPPLTPEAQREAEARARERRLRGPADSWQDRSFWERCITRGVLGSILPSGYNNGNQILQTHGLVVLRNEMIHETRFIPLDGRPHPGAGIRSYMGDSRGHWESSTLVVETTNFKEQPLVGGAVASDALRLIERLTRLDADTIEYRVTVDDPKTWTKPFTIAFPIRHEKGYQIFEYACHEGNYYMYDALTGARAEEKGKASR